MKGTLYLVGVGPGDPELLTLKAARILQKCPTWFAPKAHREGDSTALAIAGQVVELKDKNILTHRFPMKHVRRGEKIDPELEGAWKDAAKSIIACLERGEDVAFPTLGDPAIYSTSFYVYEVLAQCNYTGPVEVVPGVSSIGASAASAEIPLCLGDERLLVLPATFENGKLKELIQNVDAVVFMKVYRVLDRMIEFLESEGLVEKAVLIERTSCGDQRIWHNIYDAQGVELHYFSTMLLRK